MEGGGGVQQVGMISDVGKEVFCIREMVFSAEQTCVIFRHTCLV